MSTQNDLADIALGELGNGPDKYRSWYYGCEMYGTAWCAVFVSWCANECGILNTLVPKEDGAGCFAREGVPKGWGAWLEAKRYVEPKQGDIITFRDWGTSTYSDKYHADHVGLVVGVNKASDGTYNISTVEGNTNGSNDTSRVNSRSYNSINSYVWAYYRPNYENTTDEPSETEENYMECKNGDTNNFVLTIKRQLQALYSIGVIQSKCDDSKGFGDGTEEAIKEVQGLSNITVDGICGEKTIKAIDALIKNNITKNNTAVTKSTTVAELSKLAGV